MGGGGTDGGGEAGVGGTNGGVGAGMRGDNRGDGGRGRRESGIRDMWLLVREKSTR